MDENFVYVVSDGRTRMVSARFTMYGYLQDLRDGEGIGFRRELVFRPRGAHITRVVSLCESYVEGAIGREDLETRVLELEPAN